MRIARPYSVTEVSAGGLIVNAENPRLVALISHRNRGGGMDWCIPKGHVELGENYLQTAIREVREETGLHGEVLEKIGEISYSFKIGPKRIRKTVHHYLLKQVSGELSFQGDPTGEVLDVKWFEIEKLEEVLAHENERKIAERALEILS
ncbi:NUDIX hydrolase [Aquiluna borgnonia]|jgi:8-oxo-dGTP pyrophosphatase MutT (NUDIX family)|uniref:NUDIX hydrolase n=1 Tax=Aquiluna borgnonia TaxID=2499157 RepID=A0A7D4QCD0_9MICO|nr:NUDIX hydrolase [Aquiluna borgnonia]QKJ25890.1 NUDIX hydrolase [Aquiluna borgnonia]